MFSVTLEKSSFSRGPVYARRRRMGEAAGGPSDKVGATRTDEPEWPSHFPHGCPCPECMPGCRDVNERVYRIARIPRNPLDAKSHLERPEIDPNPESPPCQRASLSSHLDLDHLREVKRTRKYWKNRHIVAADLRPEHGRIAPTLDGSHHSLWLRAQYLAVHDTLFAEVVE